MRTRRVPVARLDLSGFPWLGGDVFARPSDVPSLPCPQPVLATVTVQRHRGARARFLILAAGLLALTTLCGAARAAETPDRSQAEAILAAPPLTAQVGDVARGAARAALQRAAAANGTGAADHRTRLEALALEWSTLARDLEQAAAVEAEADKLQSRVTQLEEEVRRAQALLEEAEARRGRARAKAEALKGAPRGTEASR